MDDFRDLMYDLIIESLVDKLDNYEITMEDAELFSEAAYDELFYEARRETKELTKMDQEARNIRTVLKYGDSSNLDKKYLKQRLNNIKSKWGKIPEEKKEIAFGKEIGGLKTPAHALWFENKKGGINHRSREDLTKNKKIINDNYSGKRKLNPQNLSMEERLQRLRDKKV